MAKIYAKIAITQQNRDRLMNECMIELLKHHPELKGMFLSQDFMITKLIDYYLK